MRQIVVGGLIVLAPDLRVYTKEANVLRVTWNPSEGQTFDNKVDMTIGADVSKIGGLSASYVLSEKKVEIDISTIIAISGASGETALTISIANVAGDSANVEFEIGGVSRPLYVPEIAYKELADYVTPISGVNGVVIPPSFYFDAFEGANIYFPIAFHTGAEIKINSLPSALTGDIIRVISKGNTGINFKVGEELIYNTYAKALDCGRKYCALRHKDSLTGLTKTAIWELLSPSYATESEVAIQQINKQFKTYKNELVLFTARLPQLDAYDYNYYRDIVTADVVECKIEGSGEWKKVKVTTDSVVVADGSEATDLSININYVRNEY